MCWLFAKIFFKFIFCALNIYFISFDIQYKKILILTKTCLIMGVNLKKLNKDLFIYFIEIRVRIYATFI